VSTRDGRTWTDVRTFHEQVPAGYPYELVQRGGWWILVGNDRTPEGQRRATMWTSTDLRRWYEMPKPIRGPRNYSVISGLAAHAGRVVGIAYGDRANNSVIYVWTKPS
jgi:hypothetical protein